MKVLLSIKPEFTAAIHAGSKRYEYRRKIFSKECDEVLIYCTSPVQKIVSKFGIKEVLRLPIDELWERTSQFGGIDECRYRAYFSGLDYGYAIAIDELEVYDNPIDPKEVIDNFTPPQSFLYVKSDEAQMSFAL